MYHRIGFAEIKAAYRVNPVFDVIAICLQCDGALHPFKSAQSAHAVDEDQFIREHAQKGLV